MALGNGSATLAMPVYLSCIVLLLTVCGGIIFDEFDGMQPANLALLAAGVGLTVAGICLLTLAQGRRSLAASRARQTARVQPSALEPSTPPRGREWLQLESPSPASGRAGHGAEVEGEFKAGELEGGELEA